MKSVILLILSVLVFASAAALAESPLPENAVAATEVDAGAYRICVYRLPETGEQLTLLSDIATGEKINLYGMCETLSSDTPMDAQTASALLWEMYPDALVISSADVQAMRRLTIVAPDFLGCVFFDADGVCGRDIDFAECIRDDILTYTGALEVLRLLRPEAFVTEIELDHDDGLLLYEGEALVDGREYEFELDAYTARLLQWDRD